MGPFVVEESDGSVALIATKPSSFRAEFVISDDKRVYELKSVSTFRRQYDVFAADERIGSIVPDSLLGRKATLHFTDEVPRVLLQAFFTWLTLLMWKRAAAASGA